VKVFVSTTSFGAYKKEPIDILKRFRLDVDLNPFARKLEPQEISELLAKTKYVGLIAGTEDLGGSTLKKALSLRVISRVGVGLDNIDLKAAEKKKIKVYGTPGILTDAVAELTLGLILSALRRIPLQDRNLRSGRWQKEMGTLLRGKVAGLIGFGRVGRRVAKLLRAFGVKVIFTDIEKKKPTAFSQVSLNRLLKEADIVSLHAATKKEIISQKEISIMKRGAIFINTSRGDAVHEKSLVDALRSGQISVAALDVFHKEPYAGKLLELENVILTPHIGSYAEEARFEMEKQSAENLIKGLKQVGLL